MFFEPLEQRQMLAFSPPTVSLLGSVASFSETGATQSVTAVLSTPWTQSVTVMFRFSGTAGRNVDYTASSTSLIVPAGQISQTISLVTGSDNIFEGDESLTVAIRSIANATASGSSSTTFTIVDDETIPRVSLSASSATINENGATASVTATLTNPSSQDITVNLAYGGTATRNVDYLSSNVSLFFPAGTTTRAAILTALDDNIDELNESIFASINTVTNAVENGTQSVTLTINDNDAQPTVNLSLANSPFAETGGVARVIATLTNPGSQNITANLQFTGTAINNTDYTASNNVITFLPGETSGSITLTASDDVDIEGTETAIVRIQSITGLGTIGASGSVTASITDNDVPFVSLAIGSTSSSFAENAGTLRVRASLDSTTTQTVLVDLAFAGTAALTEDYIFSSRTISIPSGSLTGEITLTGVDDLISEGTESVQIDINAVTGANEQGTQSVTASILDDASDAILQSGNIVSLTGTPSADTISIVYLSPTTFRGTVNGVSAIYSSATTIYVDGVGGNDLLNVTTSDLVDLATFNDQSGTIASSNYTINFTGMERTAIRGDSLDNAMYNDLGTVNTVYLLPQYGIMQGSNYYNQAIGFGSHTFNAVGNNDTLYIYGDTSNQEYVATPTTSLMIVSGKVLTGNNAQRVYAYGMGGNDKATYSGSALSEVMTALQNYTYVTTSVGGVIDTIQYFDRFKQLIIDGNAGNDVAVMYDSPGNDTFNTLSNISDVDNIFRQFTFSRPNVFSNVAKNYDDVYAFQVFGGADTATLYGGDGNDNVTATEGYTIMNVAATLTFPALPASKQQATGFSSVIVRTGGGIDTVKFYDSIGDDIFNAATAGTAAIQYYNGRSVQVTQAENITAVSYYGGINRKNVNLALAGYSLIFLGNWV
jgi:hypothetical protein